MERVVEWQFENANIFALADVSTALCQPGSLIVFRDKKVQFFGNGAGTHEGFKNLVYVGQTVAGFLFDFGFDGGSRVACVEQASTRLDKHSAVPVDVSRKAELPGQDNHSPFAVVGQDNRAVAAIIRFTRKSLPRTIGTLILERGLFEDIPVIRQRFNFQDADAVIRQSSN